MLILCKVNGSFRVTPHKNLINSYLTLLILNSVSSTILVSICATMTTACSSILGIVKIFSLIGHNLDFPKTNLYLISSFVIICKNEIA